MYVPLTIDACTSIDLLIFSLHIAGLSSILSSINLAVTVLSSRFASDIIFIALPIFPYSMLVTSFLVIIALPVLASAITLILFDRNFNTVYFNPFLGGDILLFQHLF